jgi:DNA-binding transcriptional LysR family regulator
MDYLSSVRAFARVVETGSFVKAAHSLRVPRNSVTKQIQALEAHLRVKLLSRTTRRVAPTNEGAAYYQRVSRLLEEWQEIEAEATSAQLQPRGRLRVDMGSALAVHVVIPKLASLQARYPDLELDIGASDRPVDLLAEGLDCVVRAGRITDTSLIARHIADLPFALCATPAYVRKHGRPKTPEDLNAGHTLIRYFFAGSNSVAPIELAKGTETHQVDGKKFFAVNDGNAHIAAGLAGLGIIHTLQIFMKPFLESGELVPLLPAWHAAPVPINVLYSPNRHLSSRVRVFVEWMAELLKGDSAPVSPAESVR